MRAGLEGAGDGPHGHAKRAVHTAPRSRRPSAGASSTERYGQPDRGQQGRPDAGAPSSRTAAIVVRPARSRRAGHRWRGLAHHTAARRPTARSGRRPPPAEPADPASIMASPGRRVRRPGAGQRCPGPAVSGSRRPGRRDEHLLDLRRCRPRVLPAEIAIMASPTSIGVFGMTRTTGVPAAGPARKRRGSPGDSTRPGPGRSRGRIGSSGRACGLTATTRTSLRCAAPGRARRPRGGRQIAGPSGAAR